ncbi:LysE family translocator [Lichenibacterium minor]|uniref:LysE family translocator n=1 Tax=Lichenibacterium minor TaxID=2316528 RepID=A0A4Q2U1Y6_9HYPH|nr:LysE family translocator [Lichenibacterium minor]RYC30499.1 LysE family translocator [Lichenibacterium minor]
MGGTELTVFALALAVGAGSPGPSVAALVSRVLTRGVRDVLPFLAALWLGEAVWLTLVVAGLSAAAQTFGSAFAAIRYAGVAYLLVLAWRMWHAPTAPAADAASGRAERQAWRLFGAGLLVSLGNPKNMVFYVALLPSLVDIGHVGVSGWAELVATMVAVLAAVDLGWACAAAGARRWLVDGRTMRIANRIGASMMAGAAAAVAVR